jgi:RNA polymerase sigma-70 factor (ECF subfamily)
MSSSEGRAIAPTAAQDELYRQVAHDFAAALDRLSGAYESDPDRRRDLLQDVQIALWRSLAIFDGRCSLRTWVYRVAHNTATSRVIRRRAHTPVLVSLDEIEAAADSHDRDRAIDRERAMDRLMSLIRMLRPPDRQIILLYLEGLDAASIGEITGLSSGNVATKVHRVKKLLTARFHEKAGPDGR